jgi:thioredoxin-dependent peroxiredoxin
MSTVDDQVSVGEPTPDFTLRDAGGREWHLADHFGRTIVLLFYPGDETPVCTRQLCSVRDNWEQYRATGAEVVGVSTDSEESHKKFAENHGLPLTLLSDPKGEVSRLFGVKSWLPNRSARAVVVIDSRGIVRYRKVQPLSIFRPRDDEIIGAIRAAQAADA